MMKYAYANRRRISPGTGAPKAHGSAAEHALPNSVHLAALSAGTAAPTEADKGARVDLPEAMRAKMENAFGADFSGVKLYESQTVADAGAEAVTRGSSIAFAPGKLNLSSRGGQELLGHELSHVASQQRGEVTGGGFLNDRGLEARADREGTMAAAGEQVYSGPVTHALSGASPAPAAAGPMQAKCGRKQAKQAKQALQNEQGQDEKQVIQSQVGEDWKNYDPNNPSPEGDDSALNRGFIARMSKKKKKRK